MRHPELTGLSPSTECYARRSGPAPWRFTAAFRDGADEITASFLLGADGVPLEFDAHPGARARVERALPR